MIPNIKKVSPPLTLKTTPYFKKERRVRGHDTFLESPFKSGLLYKTFLDEDEFEDVNIPVIKPDGYAIDIAIHPNYIVHEGNRYNTISAIAMQLIYLNAERTDRQTILNGLLYFNRWYCQPDLGKNEVIRIFNDQYKKYQDGNLDISKYLKPKRVFWSRRCTLTRDEKHKLAMKTHSAKRKELTEIQIYETIEYLQDGENKITQKKIAENAQLGIATIKRYVKANPDLKDLYKSYNKNLFV